MNDSFSRFSGFSAQCFEFLRELRANNTKEWFESHRQEYQQFVLVPMQELVADLAPVMLGVDPLFEVAPRVGKTIARIYRDTRFSKDKSPYKTNQWFTFKRPKKEWLNHPAYFFELSPDACRFGMGFYCADRASMDRFRAALEDDPKRFLDTIDFFGEGIFSLEGDRYKRPLQSGIPFELQEWYHRKSFYLVRSYAVDERQGIPASFASVLEDSFAVLAPLYRYLSRVTGP